MALSAQEKKQQVAAAALAELRDGMVLGVGTVASTAVFGGLKPTDGSAVSRHRADRQRADLSATES